MGELTHRALRTVAGEELARRFLERLRTESANADDLAIEVAKLYGPELRGFCCVLVKELGGGNA